MTLRKTFSSKNTFQQHITSKKHIDAEREGKANPKNDPATNALEEITYDKASSNKERLLTVDDVSVCLFCNFKSEDLEE